MSQIPFPCLICLTLFTVKSCCPLTVSYIFPLKWTTSLSYNIIQDFIILFYHNMFYLDLPFPYISSILPQELYCDASLACCGRVYPVHQVVLSACSEFFSNVFTQASASQQQPLVVVQGAGRDEVECLLEFMYTGQVTISRVHLPALLRVASSLQVKGLLEAQGLQQEVKGQQSEAGVEDERLKAKGKDSQFEDNLERRQFQNNEQLIAGMSPGRLETETGQTEDVECDMVKDEVTGWETGGGRMERLGETASGLANSLWSERQLTRMAPTSCDSHPHDIVSHDTRLIKKQSTDNPSPTNWTHDYDAQHRPSSAKSRWSPLPTSNRKSPCPAPGVRTPSPSLTPLTTHRGPFHSLVSHNMHTNTRKARF